MNWWKAIPTSLKALFHGAKLDCEVDKELRLHIEMQTTRNLEAGMTEEAARSAALRQFGWRESIRQECREQRSGRWLEDVAQDARFGIRQLFRNPGFTIVAVLTLALGIGANTAVFSVIRGVLLKPLPYPAQDKLVTLWERNPQRGIEQDRVSGPDYLDWRAQNTTFADMAVSPGWEGVESFNLVLGDTTVKVQASYTCASLFSTLGTAPLLGRALLPEEDRKEGNRATVLSYGLWQRYFGGSSNVLGQTLTLDTYGRRDYTIVGVMPPGFGLPGRCELWLPIGWMGVTLTERRSAHWHTVIARLKPGVTLARARAELSTIQARLQQAYPGEAIGSAVDVVPLLDQAVGRYLRTGLLLLWGVVAGVLLIACANVANLMLVRASGRQKELALRLALGAGRWRVVRQLLVESLVLGVVGGACGALLAWLALYTFIALAPGGIPRLAEVTLDQAALALTLGTSLVAGVLFGLAPAWQCSRPDLNEALKTGTHAPSAEHTVGRLRSVLVVAEVGLSVTLLVGAGLMLQSFARMLSADRGIRVEHLLTAELDFSVSGFTTWVQPTATRPQVPLRALIERLRALPGVQTVGAASRLPRRNNQPPSGSFAIFGRPGLRPEEQPKAEFKGITPDWFRALGGRVLRGRDFTEADRLEAPGAVLINQTMASRYFPNEDPIGQRLRMGGNQPPLEATNVWGLPEWSAIVGVVTDVKSLHPQPEVVPEVYQSYWQWPMQSPTLLIRTTGDPAALAEAIHRETKATIPNLPPPSIRSMDSLLAESVAQPRLQTGLLSAFATLGLILAAVGLYGVLAYVVGQRTHEIGIRLALGAQKNNVLSLVIRQGMKLALTGAGVGLLAALALTRLMRSLLYQVGPDDPLTFVVVTILLVCVALLACWLPARRAARVEPMVALRSE
jgi:putative ABC transport system permease protein